MTDSWEPRHIQLLGGFGITYDGKPPNDQRCGMKTCVALSYLLLRHGQLVPTRELASILELDVDGKHATMPLRVLIHRIRKQLSSVADDHGCIKSTRTTRMTYSWNMDCDIEVDLFKAEALCDSVMQAKRLSDIGTSEIDRLVDLCGQELLPELRDKDWVEVSSSRYRILHSSAMAHVLGLMSKAGDTAQIILTCNRGLAKDQTNEALWTHLQRAMGKTEAQIKMEIAASQ